jgi:hypothetical protein
MTLEDELLKIEEAFWIGGEDVYVAHADAACTVVFSEMAASMPRDEIAKTAEAGRWQDVSLEPVALTTLSDTSAIITYRCSARRRDGQPYEAFVSSAYVKRASSWKLAFHQQTTVVRS